MKIHDFGLWFRYWHNRKDHWSTTIYEKSSFQIYYDGEWLGDYRCNFDLDLYYDEPHIIKLRNKFLERSDYNGTYMIGRLLTLDDFEIIENPEYRGAV